MHADEVRKIRENAGLSQQGLADLLRMADKKTVYRWEGGKVPVSGPSSVVLEMMAAMELPKRFYPGAKPPYGMSAADLTKIIQDWLDQDDATHFGAFENDLAALLERHA